MIKGDLTYTIIGCAMKVHNEMGNGFQETIYQRSLAIELNNAGVQFAREVTQNVMYKGIQVGTRRVDFVVENQVIVELKAVYNLENIHLVQAKNYLTIYNFEKGLLINFGAPSLQYKLIFKRD